MTTTRVPATPKPAQRIAYVDYALRAIHQPSVPSEPWFLPIRPCRMPALVPCTTHSVRLGRFPGAENGSARRRR